MKTQKEVKSVKAEGKFKDRDLTKVDPNKEQFPPTTADPIPQHKRMAGAS